MNVEVDTLELVSFQEPIFNTIQGEGTLMGTPSTFIRLQRCNQTCSWCDTKDSWLTGLGTVLPIGAIIDKLQEVGCLDHVVITGGNPMLQSGRVKSLLSAAFFRDKHITIETNAFNTDEGGEWENLCLPHLQGLLWSLSPKLHHIDLTTVRGYLQGRGLSRVRHQMKLVVASISDVRQAGLIFKHFIGRGMVKFDAILQPEWSSMRKLTKDPNFLPAVTSIGIPVRVLVQSHKTLAVM